MRFLVANSPETMSWFSAQHKNCLAVHHLYTQALPSTFGAADPIGMLGRMCHPSIIATTSSLTSQPPLPAFWGPL